MAAAEYIKVNGASRKVSNQYIKNQGTTRKISKGYIKVNNLAKPFYTSEVTISGTTTPVNGVISLSGIPSGAKTVSGYIIIQSLERYVPNIPQMEYFQVPYGPGNIDPDSGDDGTDNPIWFDNVEIGSNYTADFTYKYVSDNRISLGGLGIKFSTSNIYASFWGTENISSSDEDAIWNYPLDGQVQYTLTFKY